MLSSPSPLTALHARAFPLFASALASCTFARMASSAARRLAAAAENQSSQLGSSFLPIQRRQIHQNVLDLGKTAVITQHDSTLAAAGGPPPCHASSRVATAPAASGAHWKKRKKREEEHTPATRHYRCARGTKHLQPATKRGGQADGCHGKPEPYDKANTLPVRFVCVGRRKSESWKSGQNRIFVKSNCRPRHPSVHWGIEQKYCR